MGTAGFGRSFAPIVQYEKWEIHPVFPHFPYFRLCQNLSPNLLAPLCGAALIFDQIQVSGFPVNGQVISHPVDEAEVCIPDFLPIAARIVYCLFAFPGI